MRTRKAVTKEVAKRYRKASKTEKGRILDEFCATTGFNRSYAARILRKGNSNSGGKGKGRPPGQRGQGRKPVYTAEVVKQLTKIWAILNFPCGKRLVANLAEIVRVLEGFGEITLSPEVKEKLLSVSAATADRLLAPERKKMERRLKTDEGRAIYKKRGQTVEPVFGQIKEGRGFNRFSRRGRPACRSEWKFMCAVHNLLKLWRAGGSVAQAAA